MLLIAAAFACRDVGDGIMKIAVSSDARTHLVDAVLDDLDKRGHQVEYLGPELDKELDWPIVTLDSPLTKSADSDSLG
jgi:hypothetical protein